MNAAQLMYIKRAQRDFEAKFHTRLQIDFPAMNEEGALVDSELILEKALQEYCRDYEVSVEDVRSVKRGNHIYWNTAKGRNIRRVLGDFSKYVKRNKYSDIEAGRLINRNRSMICLYSREKV